MTTDPSYEQIEKCLTNTDFETVPKTDNGFELQPGDLVAMTKPEAFGVVVSVNSKGQAVEVLLGGDTRKGRFDEEPGTVRLISTGEILPIQNAWRLG